jgi:hypothetical protein
MPSKFSYGILFILENEEHNYTEVYTWSLRSFNSFFKGI